MHRTSFASLAALPLALVVFGAPLLLADEPERVPLVHLQTDLESYRLGETLWYRAHVGEASAFPLTVQLVQPPAKGAPGQAQVLATQTLSSAKKVEGKVFLKPTWPGGRLVLRVRAQDGRLLHRLPIDVYDLDSQPIGVRLRVLGELFVPGDTLTATVKATGPKGRALANQTLQDQDSERGARERAPGGRPRVQEGPRRGRGSGQGLGWSVAGRRFSRGRRDRDRLRPAPLALGA